MHFSLQLHMHTFKFCHVVQGLHTSYCHQGCRHASVLLLQQLAESNELAMKCCTAVALLLACLTCSAQGADGPEITDACNVPKDVLILQGISPNRFAVTGRFHPRHVWSTSAVVPIKILLI